MFGSAYGSSFAQKDVEITPSPTDSISEVSFSPTGNFLLGSSWDSQTRCWELQSSGAVVPKVSITHDSPVLSCCWSSDGTKIFSAGCDKIAKAMDLGSGQIIQVAQHDAPIRSCRWLQTDKFQGLITGSWDKTIKYWDMRSSSPAATVQLPERVYTMDLSSPMLVVGCAERHIAIIDVNNPTMIWRNMQSPMRFQTRTISIFPAKDGFAIGSVEGRCWIVYFNDPTNSKSFSFKCHRQESADKSVHDIYPVNAIAFHQQQGTFCTAGADGTVAFWDKESKVRMKFWEKLPNPVNSVSYNYNGTLLAYSSSYDWSKGHEYYTPSTAKNQIFVHPLKDEEIKSKKK